MGVPGLERISKALAKSKHPSTDLNSSKNFLKSFSNMKSVFPLVGGRLSMVAILVCRNYRGKGGRERRRENKREREGGERRREREREGGG